MLTYHVEWHLRDALAPLLFHDTELAATRAERSSPIVSAEPSEIAKTKKATKRSANGLRHGLRRPHDASRHAGAVGLPGR
jgi:hypothetical protein